MNNSSAVYLPICIGGHVNDVKWPARDHQVPLIGGGVPFERLLPFFPAGVPLVWELSGRAAGGGHSDRAGIVGKQVSADVAVTIL